MGLINAIGNFFKGVASVFTWATNRSTLENSVPMQENAAAKTDSDVKAKAATDVANPDPKNFEEGIS